ncbi:MAG: ERCC4 domain-containing protein [bacterium]
MKIILDTREPSPHPWSRFWEGVEIETGTLETGDMTVNGFNDLVAVERKTTTDFLGCIGGERERFERELKRSRQIGHFIVIVDGTLANVMVHSRGIPSASIIGTVAAWTRRYCPIVFCDTECLAAHLALRWMLQPFDEARKIGMVRTSGGAVVAGETKQAG